MKVLVLMDFIREEHYSVSKEGKPTFNLFNTTNGKTLKSIMEKTTGLKRTVQQKDYDIAYVYNQIPTPIRNDYGKIIKYQDVKQSEVKPFYPALTKQIVDKGYDIIVPTGKLGVKFLLNVSSIGTVRGVPEKVTLENEGKEHSVWVLPTYSIEYTNVNKNAERQVLADFKTLGKFVREGEKVFKPSEVSYELVTNIERVREIFNKEIKNDNEDGYDITAWDLETNSLQPDREGSKPLVLSMSWSNGQGVTIPIYKADFQWANGQEDINEILSLLKEWVASNEDIKVLHNATYDINFLMTTLGFKNFENNRDTKVGWYLAVTQEQAESLRLSDLAYEVTDQGGYDKPLEEYKVWFVNKLLRFFSDKIKEIQKENKKVAKKEFDVKAPEYKEWLENKLESINGTLDETDKKFGVTEYQKKFQVLGLTAELVNLNMTMDEDFKEVVNQSPEYMSLSDEAKRYTLDTAIRLINTHGSNTEVVNEVDGSKFNYDWIPLELMHPYASGDTDVCRRIYCEVVDRLKEQKRDKAFDLLNRDYPRLIRTLARIQSNGLHCDLDYMYSNDTSYEIELENTVNRMREHWSVKEFEEYQYGLYEAGLEEFSKPKSERDPEIEAYRTKFKDNKWMFSPASGVHKGKVVYDILGVNVPYGKETVKDKPFNNGTKEQDLTWEDYKTDASTLKQALANVEREEDKEIIELLLYYASLNTKRNSFTKKLPNRVNKNTSKLHGGFNSTGTASGRLSSSNPNLQQLPSHTSDVNKFDYKHPVKRSFTSRFDNGVILQADYSALEMRITALYTDDREMLEMFLTGQDIHKNTASIMYNKKMEDVTAEERQASKAVAFGLIYGESPFSFAGKNGMPVEEAEEIFDKFYSNKPAIKSSIDKTHEFVQKHGYVETMNGHRRNILSATSNDKKIKNEGLRQSFNTIIQGTGGYLTNMAITFIDDFIEKYNMKSKLVATVHDSIVVDTHPDEVYTMGKVVVHVMENLPYDFLKIDINGERRQYPIDADMEIGLNYNDLVEFNEEEMKTFNSFKGYIQYKMALQTVKDYFESDKLTEEQMNYGISKIEEKKNKYQQI